MSHAYSDEFAQPVRPREAHAPGITNGQLFEVMRRIADACFDGHMTIMKFTTNWRVRFGDQSYLMTRLQYESTDAAIQAMPVGATLREPGQQPGIGGEVLVDRQAVAGCRSGLSQ